MALTGACPGDAVGPLLEPAAGELTVPDHDRDRYQRRDRDGGSAYYAFGYAFQFGAVAINATTATVAAIWMATRFLRGAYA